jgi:cullin 3
VRSTGYNLVLHKHGDMLHDGVRDELAAYLETVAARVEAAHDGALLSVVAEAWAEHRTTLSKIKDILMYMDRSYVPTAGRMAVWDLGLTLFRERVIQRASLRERIRAAMLDCVERERQGEVVERDRLRDAARMLVEAGVGGRACYAVEFEERFLDESRRRLDADAQRVIAQATASEFLRFADRTFQSETERCRSCLDPSTLLPLKHILVSSIIERHATTLLSTAPTGLSAMLRDDRVDGAYAERSAAPISTCLPSPADLRLFFKLFSLRDELLKQLEEAVGAFVSVEGQRIVANPAVEEDASRLVGDLISLRDKFDRIVKDAFSAKKSLDAAVSRVRCLASSAPSAFPLALVCRRLWRASSTRMHAP